MPEGNEAQTSTQTAGQTANNDIENVMSGMQEQKPESKPGETAGEKDAGSKGAANEKSGSEVKHPAWMAQLGNIEAENAEKLSKFEKIGDLAKNYLDLAEKLGNSITKPGEDASDEEKEAFYRALGKPEAADKYSIEGEDAAVYRDIAYKNNLTDEQAKGIFQSLQEIGNKTLTAMQEKQKATFAQQAHDTQAALQKEYGKDYQTKIELLKRGVATFGGANMGAKLQQAGLLADYDVVKMFINLGEMSSEAGSPGNTKGKADGYKSIAEGGTLDFGDTFKKK